MLMLVGYLEFRRRIEESQAIRRLEEAMQLLVTTHGNELPLLSSLNHIRW